MRRTPGAVYRDRIIIYCGMRTIVCHRGAAVCGLDTNRRRLRQAFNALYGRVVIVRVRTPEEGHAENRIDRFFIVFVLYPKTRPFLVLRTEFRKRIYNMVFFFFFLKKEEKNTQIICHHIIIMNSFENEIILIRFYINKI